MGNENGILAKIKKLLSNGSSNKKPGKYQYLILLFLFGAVIMLLSNIFLTDKSSEEGLEVFGNDNKENHQNEEIPAFGQKSSKQNDMITEYENAYENQLKEALEGIQGVSEVTVVVNVEATEKKVLEKNSNAQTQITDETDREGGKRKVEDSSKEDQLVIIREGEKEVPIVVETKKPEIRGVLVVAKGADNIQVKKWIIEAVTRSLGVPSHRLAVLPKKD